jgi:hypothetical protein
MFQFQIDKHSRDIRESIIDTLNRLEILHSIKDFVLSVSDDDSARVKGIIAGLDGTVESWTTDLVPSRTETMIRYDISELDPLVCTALLHDLEVDHIKFTLNDSILVVSKSLELKVDEHLARIEREVRELESMQKNARLEKSGHQALPCEFCGQRPAAPIDLRRQVGMVIVMRQYRASAVLCERCAQESYSDFQKSTALKGWTGVRSALTNPVIIGANIVNKKRHKDNIRKLNGGQ